MSVIDVQNLSKRYGDRYGIRQLDLNVPEGSVFGFLGPNGSGKTTTIRILLGLMHPTEGRATVLGRDAWNDSAQIRAEVGYIPGDLRLYPWMNARNGLHFLEQVRKRPVVAPGLALAEKFSLERDVPVQKMSRGMRQKLGLLFALAHGPRVLILDEPTTALDPPMQQLLYEELRTRAAAGTTVFFSSHTLSEVEQLCERVAILRDGRLVTDEPVDALRRRARRHAVLVWKDGRAPEHHQFPSFLAFEERRGTEWHFTLDGDPMALVQWAAAQPLADFVITPPDLDRLFRRFYEIDAP